MVAFIVLIGIIFGGVKLLAIANNISDNEAMDKYKGFISNYKDKHNNIIKGCYIIK